MENEKILNYNTIIKHLNQINLNPKIIQKYSEICIEILIQLIDPNDPSSWEFYSIILRLWKHWTSAIREMNQILSLNSKEIAYKQLNLIFNQYVISPFLEGDLELLYPNFLESNVIVKSFNHVLGFHLYRLHHDRYPNVKNSSDIEKYWNYLVEFFNQRQATLVSLNELD